MQNLGGRFVVFFLRGQNRNIGKVRGLKLLLSHVFSISINQHNLKVRQSKRILGTKTTRPVSAKKEQSKRTNVVVFVLAVSVQQTHVQLEATIAGFCFFTVEVL